MESIVKETKSVSKIINTKKISEEWKFNLLISILPSSFLFVLSDVLTLNPSF